jgi:hypothetical protein
MTQGATDACRRVSDYLTLRRDCNRARDGRSDLARVTGVRLCEAARFTHEPIDTGAVDFDYHRKSRRRAGAVAIGAVGSRVAHAGGPRSGPAARADALSPVVTRQDI